MHPDDLGKVIGRGGRTATALRTLVTGIGGRGIRVDVVDTDQLTRTRHGQMELVVGRVAKPHGVRGELVVEVRTDEPDLRFAPGSTLTGRRPRPRRPPPTPSNRRARTPGGCFCVSTASPTALPPMRSRHAVRRRLGDAAPVRGSRRVLRP